MTLWYIISCSIIQLNSVPSYINTMTQQLHKCFYPNVWAHILPYFDISVTRTHLRLTLGEMLPRCTMGDLHHGCQPILLCKLCTNLSHVVFSLFELQLKSEQMNKSTVNKSLWSCRQYVCVCVSTYSMIREGPSKHIPDVELERREEER